MIFRTLPCSIKRIRPFKGNSRFLTDHVGSDVEVDFGDYEIVLPPENSPEGVQDVAIREVPSHIPLPSYARPSPAFGAAPSVSNKSRFVLGSEEERKMRKACNLAKQTLDYAGSLVKIGETTSRIDSLVHDFIIAHGAYPSPLRYHGFPKSICTSVNNIISHGIPDERPLQNGDTINVDVTVFLDGYHGDTSRTFAVGDVDAKGQHLLSTAYQALQVGISACGPGKPIKGIGNAIQRFISSGRVDPQSQVLPLAGQVPFQTESRPQHDGIVYNICSAFSGHGIGSQFHTQPWIYHSSNDEPGIMEPGDSFTIEPIILQSNLDEPTQVWIWGDDWTTSTENGARGAVFEHTVMITPNGVDILTL
ncbi:Creatinase/aminopeptidase [Serendipita vermifera]|nr:Creatinase/aminopeptidase [Serendipita vermifera]